MKDEWSRREGISAAVLEISRCFRRIDALEAVQSLRLKYDLRARLSSVIAVDSWEEAAVVDAGVKDTGSGSSVACMYVTHACSLVVVHSEVPNIPHMLLFVLLRTPAWSDDIIQGEGMMQMKDNHEMRGVIIRMKERREGEK